MNVFELATEIEQLAEAIDDGIEPIAAASRAYALLDKNDLMVVPRLLRPVVLVDRWDESEGRLRTDLEDLPGRRQRFWGAFVTPFRA